MLYGNGFIPFFFIMTQKSKKSLNNTLHQAKRNKNDEFYTQLTDIEKELRHYKDQLR